MCVIRTLAFIEGSDLVTKQSNYKFGEVKGRCKTNKVNAILSVIGLVLLLLLSPCKVRNFIQAELGIPQTKVLNKSQSTISQANCQNFELSKNVQTISGKNLQYPDLPSSKASSFEIAINLIKDSFNLGTLRNQLISNVPLYILYQNIQVYS